jgi:hypothetical protein
MKILSFILFWIGFFLFGPIVFYTVIYLIAIVLGFLMGHYDPSADVGWP